MEIFTLTALRTCGKNSINEMVAASRVSFITQELPEILYLGGDVTMDDLKNNLTGFNLYAFVVCWYDVGIPDIQRRSRDVFLKYIALFCKVFEES